MRWHRQWLRRQWTWRSCPGRPSTDATVRTLDGTMAAANPVWGAHRIHGELCKLAITVSERTVSRLLRRPHHPPSQTWRTFLTNHVATLVSMDFFTVPTLTGRVLFVLVLLTHQRRRIIHVNITEHPTAVWTAQQMIEAFRRLDGCCAIATRSTATCSGAESPAWGSARWSPVRPALGKIPMRRD